MQREKKLDEFLVLFKGSDWDPKTVPKGHHEYVEMMITWLKDNLANMEVINKDLAIESYLNSLQYLAVNMLDFIIGPEPKKLTQLSLYQVWLDLNFIEKHMAMVTSISLGDIKTSMREICQTLQLLLMDDIMDYLDPEKHNEKYIKVKGENMKKICDKLKAIPVWW